MSDADVRRIPRVLCVTGAYHPEFSAGGLQVRAAARLLRGRAAIRVLTTATTPGLPNDDVVEEVTVTRVYIDLRSRWSRLSAAWQFAARLIAMMPALDLVHVQGYSSKNILINAIARLFGVPVVMHLQTARHDEPPTVRAQGRLAWWAFRAPAFFISVSPALARHYLDAGLPADRITEVPNGVDAERFVPAQAAEQTALRRKLDLPADVPMILFVGVMSADKRPDVLLSAWMRLQRIGTPISLLVFVGATNPKLYELGDRLADRLRAVVDEAGMTDRVRFVPPTRRIEDYFRAADIFAMPSAREGLPISLIEAMACGLPCVASHLPGATDAVVTTGVDGWLVPAGDAEALANRLAALLRDPEQARRVGEEARRTVDRRFTMPQVADQWLSVYQRVRRAS